ncbi:MAG TPA: cytidylate kinase-like family protein [Dehalococcoidia bacterium]|nr:cytidylate kinase-like family protein [Dehalococcoidia bacterium]
MPVITISSQHGAGARDVGRLVADSLVLQYVDRAVLVDAARQLGVTVSKVARKDERTDSFRERLGHFLQRALERSAAGGQVDPMLGAANLEVMLAQTYQEMAEGEVPGIVDDRSFLEASSQIIRELGESGDVVIIGRGGQMILQDLPGSLHVQLVADEEVRATRVQEWEDLNHDEAIARMRSFNRSRAAFHKKFWKVDVWDPRLYDLVLNTNRLSYQTVADLILEAAKSEPRGD